MKQEPPPNFREGVPVDLLRSFLEVPEKLGGNPNGGLIIS
jgi:hypothetical protein